MENKEENTNLSHGPQTEEKKGGGSESKSGASFIVWAIVILVVASAVTLFAIMWGGGKEVLATVDGEEITMRDIEPVLERIKSQYASQGVDISQEEGMEEMLIFQAVQNHIQQKLLLDHAREQGLEVSDEDVQNEIDDIIASFNSREEFDAALVQAGLTEKNFKEQIRINLIAQLVAEKEGTEMNVTEEETQERYDQYSAQLGGELPPLDEVSDNIEQEIRGERVDNALYFLLEEIRENRKVEMFVEMPQPTVPPEQPQIQMQEDGTNEEGGPTEEELMEMIMEQQDADTQ